MCRKPYIQNTTGLVLILKIDVLFQSLFVGDDYRYDVEAFGRTPLQFISIYDTTIMQRICLEITVSSGFYYDLSIIDSILFIQL
jgi:hypothetical protein